MAQRSKKLESFDTRLKSTRLRTGVSNSIVSGLATMLTIASPAHSAQPPSSGAANQTLRGDMVRIGQDMRRAIIKERKREEATR